MASAEADALQTAKEFISYVNKDLEADKQVCSQTFTTFSNCFQLEPFIFNPYFAATSLSHTHTHTHPHISARLGLSRPILTPLSLSCSSYPPRLPLPQGPTRPLACLPWH